MFPYQQDSTSAETLVAFAVPDSVAQGVAYVVQAWSEVMLQRLDKSGWRGGVLVQHAVGIKPVVL